MKTALIATCLVAFGLLSPAQAADEAAVVDAKELDFGDYSSSTLTTKAWEATEAKKYDDAITFASECIKRYEKDAIAMQKELTEPVPASNKDEALSKWALNDVGTCYFIMGQAFEKQDKGTDALKAYKKSVEQLPFAQCWDPQGWFWKPADASKKQIKLLEFELIDEAEKK